MRILLGKPGLDGHDVGVKVLGHALVEAGFEVIYSGLRRSIEEIVKMAVDNKVEILGLSILSGTHLVLCEQMKEEIKKVKVYIPWIVGGNIPDDDVDRIKTAGAAAVFPTGTTIDEVIEYLKNFQQAKH
jgi:methylmalonyl-CoA mutase C-terminal domain/subunit